MSEEAKAKKEKFSRLKSFLTCPLFSKKKADELREVYSESEKINDRIQTVESSLKQFGKLLEESVKDLRKQQKAHSKKMERDNRLNSDIESHIQKLCSALAGQTALVQQFQKTALNKVDDAAGAISGVNGSIGGIRDFLSENNKTLQRFQAGYDYQILKNFVKPVTRTINDLNQLLVKLSGDEKEDLMDARDDLVELLERNGIEQIDPPACSSREGKEKETEVLPEKVKTDDSEKRNLIASVERIGYRYEFNDGQEKIIQAALVKLYE